MRAGSCGTRRLAMVGCLRVVWSRPLPSAPRSVTVYRDAAGRWWASFVVRVEPEPVGATGQATGVDVGLTTFATTEYPDADVPNPRFARAAAKALARSHRNLARKRKGSKNRVKAKTARAKVEAPTANQRRDFQHKEARTLARRFDRIGVEDLRITNMVRNRHLARSISDAGMGGLPAGPGLAGPQVRPRGSPPRPAQHDTDLLGVRCESQAPPRVGRPDLRVHRMRPGRRRDRNAARNLNPNRWAKPGEGVDGSKTLVPAGPRQPEPQNPRPLKSGSCQIYPGARWWRIRHDTATTAGMRATRATMMTMRTFEPCAAGMVTTGATGWATGGTPYAVKK